MLTDHWHDDAITHLTALLSTEETVRGLVLYGSCARQQPPPDRWSDIDLAVILGDGAMPRFYPDPAWLAPLGEIFASLPHEEAYFNVLHVFFTDGRRIDLLLINESALNAIDAWDSGRLHSGRLLLSRSPELDDALARPATAPTFTPLTSEAFRQLCTTFRVTALRAITKTARNELLVALHLSLDLVRQCLVLAMLLRDRATGDNIHRDGSRGNHYVAQLASLSQPFTREGILEMIAKSATAFDTLGREWGAEYQECRETVLAMVEKVRRAVGPSDMVR